MFFIPLIIGAAAGALLNSKAGNKIKQITQPITDTVGGLVNELKEAQKDWREQREAKKDDL